jgi:hypothetical protein
VKDGRESKVGRKKRRIKERKNALSAGTSSLVSK